MKDVKEPNSGVVLHTPPPDETLNENKRYFVHPMCEFCYHKQFKTQSHFIFFLKAINIFIKEKIEGSKE